MTTTNPTPTAAAREYAIAYEAQYKGRQLQRAVELYKDLIVLHPHTREAGYARTQVRNIVNSVVPRRELLEAETALVLAHLATLHPGESS